MEKQQSELKKSKECCSDEVCNHPKENTMKSSIRDNVEGTFHEVKGTVREVAGKLSDNPKLEVEGKCEKVAGKVQEKVGQIKKVLGM